MYGWRGPAVGGRNSPSPARSSQTKRKGFALSPIGVLLAAYDEGRRRSARCSRDASDGTQRDRATHEPLDAERFVRGKEPPTRLHQSPLRWIRKPFRKGSAQACAHTQRKGFGYGLLDVRAACSHQRKAIVRCIGPESGRLILANALEMLSYRFRVAVHFLRT